MRRLIVLAALLAFPVAGAHAATPALSCLRAGVPGTLTLLEQNAHGGPSTNVLNVLANGTATAGSARMGRQDACGDVASGGGTTAVAAVVVHQKTSHQVRVSLRSGTGGFTTSAIVRDLSTDEGSISAAKVAVGAQGDVAVAWLEYPGTPYVSGKSSVRLMVARRAAGGTAFGAPVRAATLPDPFDLDADFNGEPQFAVAVDGSGATTLVWSDPVPIDTEPAEVALRSARAPAGAAFEATARIGGRIDEIEQLALALTPGGRALAAWSTDEGLATAERPGAADGFGAPVRLADTAQPDLVDTDIQSPTVSLAADGSALVAWSAGTPTRTAIEAAWRSGPGAFGKPQEVWSEERPPTTVGGTELFPASSSGGGSTSVGVFSVATDGNDIPDDPAGPSALIGAGGNLMLTWRAQRAIGRDQLPTAWVASGTLANGFAAARRLTGDCLAATSVTPAASATGAPVVAWIDNATNFLVPGYESLVSAGRLHTQSPDQAGPSVIAPLKLGASAPQTTQVIYYDQAIKVDATCDRACDVRAWIAGSKSDAPLAATSRELTGGGRITLGLTGSFAQLPAKKPGSIRVRLRACDPSGAALTEKTVAVRAARHAAPPLAKLENVAARRDGKKVIVTWSTDRVAKRQSFIVELQKIRHPRSFDDVDEDATAFVAAHRSRRYRAVIESAEAKWATVTLSARDTPGGRRTKTVPVSRP